MNSTIWLRKLSLTTASVMLPVFAWAQAPDFSSPLSSEPRPRRIVCMNSGSVDDWERAVTRPEMRVLMNRARETLDAKSIDKGLRKRVPSALRNPARGKVELTAAERSICKRGLNTSSLATAKMRKVNYEEYDPYSDGPVTFDFGEYGAFETGDYMQEADWWQDEVFEPVWAAAIAVPPRSLQCQIAYGDCINITRNLKAGAAVACAGITMFGGPWGFVAGAACGVGLEMLATAADNDCLMKLASCTVAQRRRGLNDGSLVVTFNATQDVVIASMR